MRRPIPIIRQWWYRLWVRPDEFDISLSMDMEYMYDIQEKINYWKGRLNWYHQDLVRRREIAHRRDMP